MANKLTTALSDEELKEISRLIKRYSLKNDLQDCDIKNIYSKLVEAAKGYIRLTATEPKANVPLISQLLYNLGIDPLNYLDEVPREFLAYCRDT